MTVKERILALKLMERLEKDSSLADQLGIKIRICFGSD